MIAGVVIDSWKLEVFKRRLDAAGYTYTEHPGPFPNVTTLRVKCNFAFELKGVVEAAQLECARVKHQS